MPRYDIAKISRESLIFGELNFNKRLLKMLGKSSLNAGLLGLRLLRLQTSKFVLPAVAVLMIGKPLSATQPVCQKRNFLIYSKAGYATNSKIPPCSYEEIKALPNHPEKLLIDVREPSELQQTGQIPCSINIPLGSVDNELSPNVKAEAFEKKYGRKKPEKNSEIIFHCRIGKRSETAAETAVKLGYTNVKNYVGSWMDWAEREGLPK